MSCGPVTLARGIAEALVNISNGVEVANEKSGCRCTVNGSRVHFDFSVVSGSNGQLFVWPFHGANDNLVQRISFDVELSNKEANTNDLEPV